jgi:hypothetical protein
MHVPGQPGATQVLGGHIPIAMGLRAIRATGYGRQVISHPQAQPGAGNHRQQQAGSIEHKS